MFCPIPIFSYFAEGITNEDCWLWQDQSDGSYHMLYDQPSFCDACVVARAPN